MHTPQTEFPLSKSKIYLLLAGSVIFVAFGFYLLFAPELNASSFFGKAIFMRPVGVISLLFFGYIGIGLVKKLRDDSPGLVVNAEGIIDNSSSVAAGLVVWKDVEAITTVNVMSQKFVMVIVKNPEEYINKQQGVIKKKAMGMNYASYGSPISLSANALDTSFEELYHVVKNAFEETRQAI